MRRRSSWRELAPYLGRRRPLALLSVLSVVAGFAEAAMLILIVRIAFAVGEGEGLVSVAAGPLDAGSYPLGSVLAAAVALAILMFALQAAAGYLAADLSADSLASARRSLFRLFVSASWDLQSRERQGHLQELLSTHVSRASMAVIWVATGLAALFNFLALLASALLVQAVAALIILAMVGLLYAVVRPVIRYTRRQAGIQARENVGYATAVAESVSIVEELKTFDVGDEIARRMDGRADRVSTPYRRMKFFGKLVPELYRNAAFLFILLGMGAVHALGITELAALGAVVLLLIRGLGYTQILQRVVVHLNQLVPYLEELRVHRERYRAAAVERGGTRLQRIERLAFDGLTFSYGRDVPALDSVSFEVARGETIGVVGPSGAGKSTLFQILLRLREPTRGRYLINGSDASSFALGDWYARIGVVPQEPHLFNGSVAENIRFFRAGIGAAEIEKAARMAGIHDEIAALPQEYDTSVGERGGELSGGQRQRICLARALAASPDVVFLDEPTSALDMQSEVLVQKTLESLRGRITLFVIAHRLSTLSICNRIMALGEGRLQAFDEPGVLRETNRFYREAVALSELR